MKAIHGGDVYRNAECIDFSANINPLGTPEAVKQAMIDSLNQVHNYPDIYCDELKQKLAIFHGVSKEQLICGNGAADIIFRYVFALKPKNAIVLSPCFAEYEQALRFIGTQVLHYRLNHDNFCLEEDFLNMLTEKTDVIFLCNPNNPTGKTILPELLLKIVEKCEDNNIRLFMDECFLDFLPDEEKRSLISLVNEQTDIFVLRAFTKMYAVPGIRLGYGICSDERLISEMEKAGATWNVSIPAQAAGVAALAQQEFIKDTRCYLMRERNYLEQQLRRLNIKFWTGSANFILLYAERDLKVLLLKQGILIRDCSNYDGLSKGFYRIAVKDHENNERLIEALEKHIEVM